MLLFRWFYKFLVEGFCFCLVMVGIIGICFKVMCFECLDIGLSIMFCFFILDFFVVLKVLFVGNEDFCMIIFFIILGVFVCICFGRGLLRLFVKEFILKDVDCVEIGEVYIVLMKMRRYLEW